MARSTEDMVVTAGIAAGTFAVLHQVQKAFGAPKDSAGHYDVNGKVGGIGKMVNSLFFAGAIPPAPYVPPTT
jgi:hypothetical protein